MNYFDSLEETPVINFWKFLAKEELYIKPLIGRIIVDNYKDVDKLGFSSEDLLARTLKTVLGAIEELVRKWMEINILNISHIVTDKWVSNQELIEITEASITWDIPSLIIKAKDFLTRRNTIKLAYDLQVKSTLGISPSELMDAANKLINLSSSSSTVDSYNVGNWVDELFDYLEERRWKSLFGYSFGSSLQFLDWATRWIQKGRTYRIGAPSNMGKTQMSYGIINALVDQWAKVLFFSLENDKDMTMSNLIANRMGVNSWDIESGRVDVDMGVVWEMDGKLFIVDDTHELSEVFAKVLAIKPDVVMLDYIGLISIGKVKEDDLFTEYAKRVQQFVKKSRVWWIDLSNLANGADDATIKALWHFYWSSYLKNNADVGIHLTKYEDFYKFKDWMEAQPSAKKGIEDEEYRMNWASKKGLTITITKNRIWPAGLSEDYYVNFAKWGRFVPVPPEDKLKFSN